MCLSDCRRVIKPREVMVEAASRPSVTVSISLSAIISVQVRVILPNSLPAEHLQFHVATLVTPPNHSERHCAAALPTFLLRLRLVKVTDDDGTTLCDGQLF